MKFRSPFRDFLCLLSATVLPLIPAPCALADADSAVVCGTIPFGQLGSEADNCGANAESLINPSGNGAKLSAVMQDLEAEATPDGLWLTSTADGDAGCPNRFRVRATAVSWSDVFEALGSQDWAAPFSESGTVAASGGRAAWSRPGVVEEYSVSTDGIRQDFLISAPPFSPAGVPGTGTGGRDLILNLEIAGAHAETVTWGAKLTVEATGRELAYSRLKVTDATGRVLPARMEVPFSNRLRIVVPVPEQDLENTDIAYPIRIDPTFSDADWVSLNPSIPGVNGTVFALIMDGSGNLYAGGDFTLIGTLQANGIAKWDGSVWSSLGEGLGRQTGNPSVGALAVIGTDLYAGGQFDTAGKLNSPGIAKWNGSAWSALSPWVEASVKALAVNGGDLYAGGSFRKSGESRDYIMKWDGNGWSRLGTGADGEVRAIAVSGSDLYAGGYFYRAGGLRVNFVAKWDGNAWSAMGTGMDNNINALAVIGNDLYAGGDFNQAGGKDILGLAKWDGSSWGPVGSGHVSGVRTLMARGSDLYVGGSIGNVDGMTARLIAKWNGSTWATLEGMNSGSIYALAMSGNQLYAGGDFSLLGGSDTKGMAEWNGSAWSSLGGGMNGRVHALAVSGTNLYVAGGFTKAGGGTANRMVKWDGSTWSPLGAGMDRSVYALAASGGNLYAGGDFTRAGSVNANRIARWNGSTWSALGTGMNDTVRSLAVSGNTVYAGGAFTSAGGVDASRVARWNGSAWTALGGGLNEAVNALAVSGSTLYAGGAFTASVSVTLDHIAKWNGSAWSALGTGLDDTVNTLAFSGGNLYAGGNFILANGLYAGRIAKWNGSAWSALGTGLNNTVRTLAVNGGDLYAAGAFTSAGMTTVNRIAKWDGNTWSPLGTGMEQPVNTLALDTQNHLFAGGEFQYAGSILSSYIVQANLPRGNDADYALWASGATGSPDGETADPDGDGRSNWFEYVFGLDAKSGASANPFISLPDKATGKFRYTRRDPALTGLLCKIQTSTTMAAGSWVEDTGATQTVTGNSDGMQTVEFTLSSPIPARLFIRVVAE